jgi:hypothetical protein
MTAKVWPARLWQLLNTASVLAWLISLGGAAVLAAITGALADIKAPWRYLLAGNRAPRILRDGRSEVTTQPQEGFENTVAFCVYRHPALAETGSALFVGFDLRPAGSPSIDLMAGRIERYVSTDAANRLRKALHDERSDSDSSPFPFETTGGADTWRYDRRRWTIGAPARTSCGRSRDSPAPSRRLANVAEGLAARDSAV